MGSGDLGTVRQYPLCQIMTSPTIIVMTETDTTSLGRAAHPTVLLTGPTSGIGAAVLDRLLRHPARPLLVLLARNTAALAAAVARTRRAGLMAHGVPVDLSDLTSVASATAQVRDLVGRGDSGLLDALVLNAGIQLTDRRHVSAQGHELTFAVNVLAQHALLRDLEPLLASNAHVVLPGSSTHRGKRASFGLVPDPAWQAPQQMAAPDSGLDEHPAPAGRSWRESGGIAYATSKLSLVTLSHQWADRLGSSGRRLNVYDPGLVAGTGLGRAMKPYEYWVWRRIMPAMSVLPGATTPARTARHLVALALGDSHRTLHDGYVEIGRITAAEPATFDMARRDVLWQWCESASVPAQPKAG